MRSTKPRLDSKAARYLKAYWSFNATDGRGGFGLSVTDDGVFVFTRPDGTRVAKNDERCFRGSVAAASEPDASFEDTLRLHVLNLEAGLAIDAKTSRCRWLGESMDYSQAIEGMQFLRDRGAALRPRMGY